MEISLLSVSTQFADEKNSKQTERSKMKRSTSNQSSPTCKPNCFAMSLALFLCVAQPVISAIAESDEGAPGAAGHPYPEMPAIAPLGVRIGKHLEAPDSAKGPPI